MCFIFVVYNKEITCEPFVFISMVTLWYACLFVCSKHWTCFLKLDIRKNSKCIYITGHIHTFLSSPSSLLLYYFPYFLNVLSPVLLFYPFITSLALNNLFYNFSSKPECLSVCAHRVRDGGMVSQPVTTLDRRWLPGREGRGSAWAGRAPGRWSSIRTHRVSASRCATSSFTLQSPPCTPTSR